MTRIQAIEPDHASTPVKLLYKGVHDKLGMIPNMMRTMAVAPPVLEGYLSLSGALGNGSLSMQVREQIALTVAEMNGCGYCLAAHCALGGMAGLSKEQIHDSRVGVGADAQAQAVLTLARAIVNQRGRISDREIAAARSAGLDDAAIAEVAGNVALNIFTNYFNNLAGTSIDFPVAEPLEHAGAAACATGTCG